MSLIHYAKGFLDATRPECSSTRLAGLSATVGGIVFAYVHPSESATVAALLAAAFSFFYGRDKATIPAASPESKPDAS